MPWLFVCLFIVECGYAVSVGIVLQKNRTEPSTEIWGQKPIETDRKRKIPHRNNTNHQLPIYILNIYTTANMLKYSKCMNIYED